MEMNCSAANQEDMSVFLKSKSEFLLYFFWGSFEIYHRKSYYYFIYLSSFCLKGFSPCRSMTGLTTMLWWVVHTLVVWQKSLKQHGKLLWSNKSKFIFILKIRPQWKRCSLCSSPFSDHHHFFFFFNKIKCKIVKNDMKWCLFCFNLL